MLQVQNQCEFKISFNCPKLTLGIELEPFFHYFYYFLNKTYFPDNFWICAFHKFEKLRALPCLCTRLLYKYKTI